MRHYLTFMGGSDAQQVAYSVTLLRESAHEWYIGYERRHRNPPSDWAQLCNLLLERFGSNIRSQEAQSQLMSITQGQRLVRDYASQFETLLGRLDSYDESMMLNQFIWGLQPELARSVSLQYPKSIAHAVSLAETTELAVKASRRPAMKIGSSGNGQKGPTSSNRGRGFWRGGTGRGRGQGGGKMGNSGGRGRGYGGRRGGRGGNSNFDPLACYRCGVRGHLARDCPSTVISRRPWEVAIPALPVEHSPNPGKKAQEDVAEVARCDSGPSICCMMRTGIHIPWMMQVSCTSPLNLHKMLVMVSLRRKIQKVQKTEKILR